MPLSMTRGPRLAVRTRDAMVGCSHSLVAAAHDGVTRCCYCRQVIDG
jgi:hypothetical protein